MEKISYGGWPNCVKLTNGTVELIATTDVGPRIIRFGLVGQENEFYEDPGQMGKIGGDSWMSFGGHRLWHAPESNPRTYFPDNTPVKYEVSGNTLKLMQDLETTTGIQKEIELTLDETGGHVKVIHRLTNKNLWNVELAPWVLTVMKAGGEAIFPQEPYNPHPAFPDTPGQVIDQKYYLPVSSLVMWSYTKLNDPRYDFTSKYVIVKQDKNAKGPQKVGLANEQNWAAYANNGHLFLKTLTIQKGATYPDGGSVFTTFTIPQMLELESMGPVVYLKPGETVEHIEDWYLFDNVKFENTDESIDANVLSLVKSIM